MQRALLVAAATLTASSCSMLGAGIRRSAELAVRPDLNCVIEAVSSRGELRFSGRHDNESNSRTLTLKKVTTYSQYALFENVRVPTEFVGIQLLWAIDAPKTMMVIMIGRSASETPVEQADIDRWRPLLDSAQREIAEACRVPELKEPLAERCKISTGRSGQTDCAAVRVGET